LRESSKVEISRNLFPLGAFEGKITKWLKTEKQPNKKLTSSSANPFLEWILWQTEQNILANLKAQHAAAQQTQNTKPKKEKEPDPVESDTDSEIEDDGFGISLFDDDY
jgi:hypothetical protein